MKPPLAIASPHWPSRGFPPATESRSRAPETTIAPATATIAMAAPQRQISCAGSAGRSETAFRQTDRSPRPAQAREQIKLAFQQRQRTELDDGEEHQQRPVPEIERIADQPDPDQRRAREHDAVHPGHGRGQQKRACRRPAAAPTSPEMRGGYRERRPPAAISATPIRRVNCSLRWPDDPDPSAGQHRAGEQFKGPRERQIEGRDRISADQRDIEQEGGDAENATRPPTCSAASRAASIRSSGQNR